MRGCRAARVGAVSFRRCERLDVSRIMVTTTNLSALPEPFQAGGKVRRRLEPVLDQPRLRRRWTPNSPPFRFSGRECTAGERDRCDSYLFREVAAGYPLKHTETMLPVTPSRSTRRSRRQRSHRSWCRSGVRTRTWGVRPPGTRSALGEGISRDPIGERGGKSLYAFVLNVPTSNVDPDGLDTMLLIVGEEYRENSDVFQRGAQYYADGYKRSKGYSAKCDAVVIVDLTGTGGNAATVLQAAFKKVKAIRYAGYMGHSSDRFLFLTEASEPGANIGILDVPIQERIPDDPDRKYFATSISHIDTGNLTEHASLFFASCNVGQCLAPALAEATQKPVLATRAKVNFDSYGSAFVRFWRVGLTQGFKWHGGSPESKTNTGRDQVWGEDNAAEVQRELDALIESLRQK
jgi:hypothetical protein